jgi:hypothetical protein
VGIKRREIIYNLSTGSSIQKTGVKERRPQEREQPTRLHFYWDIRAGKTGVLEGTRILTTLFSQPGCKLDFF